MKKSLILVSGYGAPGEEDIALYRVEAEGRGEKVYGMCHGQRPSFCCRGGTGWIYAASEREDGGDITAYELQGEKLKPAARLAVPGRGLCHLHAWGEVLFGSCYESGDFFAVDAKLTKILWTFSRKDAHAHWAYTAENVLYLADLGNDCLYQYGLHKGVPEGEAAYLRQPHGSGPRQVLMLEDGSLACVNELNGTVSILGTDGEKKAAEPASGMTAVSNWPGGACLDREGTLYVCNRGPNTLAAWQWDGRRLSRRAEWGTGDWPRHIAVLSGTGHVAAACMRSHEVIGYDCRRDIPREVFRLPLAGASCVLELESE